MRAVKATVISMLTIGLLAGSAVGVAAQDEASMEAAEVTVQGVHVDKIAVPDTVTTPDGVLVGEDFVFSHIWDASDPRLDGEVTHTVNGRFHPDSGTAVDAGTYEPTNDDGSWSPIAPPRLPAALIRLGVRT
jgi:hypothetical protein